VHLSKLEHRGTINYSSFSLSPLSLSLSLSLFLYQDVISTSWNILRRG